MIALPQYIDREAWDGFVDMRRTIKKPLTVRAAKLVVYELQRIKDAGHDANAALDQSSVHCWADVYEPQDKAIQNKRSSEADRTQEYLARKHEEQTPEQRAATAERLRQAKQSIRRVA